MKQARHVQNTFLGLIGETGQDYLNVFGNIGALVDRDWLATVGDARGLMLLLLLLVLMVMIRILGERINAARVFHNGRVLQGAQDYPGQLANVRNTVDELPGALLKTGRLVQPGHVAQNGPVVGPIG